MEKDKGEQMKTRQDSDTAIVAFSEGSSSGSSKKLPIVPIAMVGLVVLSSVLLFRIATLSSEVSAMGATLTEVRGRLRQSQDQVQNLTRDLDNARKSVATKTAGGTTALSELNEVRDQLVVSLATEGKFERAVQIGKDIVKSEPGRATSWGNLAWCQFKATDFNGALESSRRGLAINPDLAFIRFNLGLMYAVREDAVNAELNYQKAIQIAKKDEIKTALSDIDQQITLGGNTPVLQKVRQILNNAIESSMIPN